MTIKLFRLELRWKIIKVKSIVEIITECDRKDMNKEHPLLSDFLEELKAQYNGSNLNKRISIFYNDWSLNPDDEDDYSERVHIKGDVLKNINSKEFQNYKVLWYDQCVFNPNFIEICVEEIKWKMKDKIQKALENMGFFETKEVKDEN